MKLKLFLLYFATILFFQGNAQLHTFRNFNHRDGLNMAAVNCLTQTNDGYIWLGTDGGDLVRYDGREFVEMQDKEGDNNHHYQNLFSSGDSILFASSYKGFYTYIRSLRKIKKLNVKSIATGEALAVYKLDSNYYFIGKQAVYHQKDSVGKELFRISDIQEPLKVYHSIKTNHAIFIFTNHGNYRLGDQSILTLANWIGNPISNVNDFKFGYFHQGKMTLVNSRLDRRLEIILNSKGGFFSMNEHNESFVFDKGEEAISYSYNKKSNQNALLTNQGRIFEVQGRNLTPIQHNFNKSLLETHQILTDINGDYWLASDLKGLYKISSEAFTRLQVIPIYESPNISFPYRTLNDEIIISLMSGETFVRNKENENELNKYGFVVNGLATINGDYYVGTNLGVKAFHPQNNNDFSDLYFKNQNVTFILADGKFLWVGLATKGLFRINVDTEEVEEFASEHDLPNYFYTGQITSDNKKIIFGTNIGIFEFNKKTKQFTKAAIDYSQYGSYSGVSTKDIYGTCWFTLEKGIVGFTSKNSSIIINGKDYFKTNLFYTLNSDTYGNIIVGTNKGITILKVNNKGGVSEFNHYDSESGFEGYETHMRSQFQSKKEIVVGTVEGLFLINTSIFENLKAPLPPVITKETHDSNHKEINSNYGFKITVNNPKAGKIQFSYRLIGYSDKWITLENENILHFNNLSNGDYKLEIRSSYDGKAYSNSSFHSFTVKLPIWKSNWFIVLVILIIVCINIILLKFNKSFDAKTLLDNNDSSASLRMTPTIMIFGAIMTTFSHIAGPLLNSELDLHLGLALTVGFTMLTLYFLSITARKSNSEHLYQPYLIIGVSVIIIHLFIELLLTKLYPFHIIGIIVTLTIVPHIFNKVKTVIIFSLLIFAASIILVIILNTTIYPKAFFLIGMFASLSLIVFISYLRFDSQEKMIFISGIINKGNIPAIAFNKKGTIIYASENISNFISSTHEEIIYNNVSILNRHIPFEGSYSTFEAINDFKDGRNYIVPLASKDGTVRWIEWAYKNFSNDVKVILGQDISEKLELENTYELLVQNAEDFIYRCDIDGNYKFLNDICYKKLGYVEEDLIGKSSMIVIPEEYVKEIEAYYQEHFSQKKKSSYKEFPIKKKNGEIIWIGQYVTTIYAAGSDNYINGFIALARDITLRREQQKTIKDQRDNITSSINYARRIQFNLLPHQRLFETSFKEHFILFKPKDIVSGDFYWKEKIDGKTIFALADSTGHGVPGSFMSLLGINLLNSIVLEAKITDPSQILNELDRRLIEILPKGEGVNKVNDAMEVTICVIDENSNEMTYACAGSRFLIRNNDGFTMFKGDNKHIGDQPHEGFTSYQSNISQFNHEDQLYLFTDGFQDQFGGPNDKKFSFRRMLEMFEKTMDKPLIEQKIDVEKEFNDWIGKGEQTDDVTLISIKRNLF